MRCGEAVVTAPKKRVMQPEQGDKRWGLGLRVPMEWYTEGAE